MSTVSDDNISIEAVVEVPREQWITLRNELGELSRENARLRHYMKLREDELARANLVLHKLAAIFQLGEAFESFEREIILNLPTERDYQALIKFRKNRWKWILGTCMDSRASNLSLAVEKKSAEKDIDILSATRSFSTFASVMCTAFAGGKHYFSNRQQFYNVEYVMSCLKEFGIIEEEHCCWMKDSIDMILTHFRTNHQRPTQMSATRSAPSSPDVSSSAMLLDGKPEAKRPRSI